MSDNSDAIIIKASKLVFPENSNQLCYFHITKAVKNKLQKKFKKLQNLTVIFLDI